MQYLVNSLVCCNEISAFGHLQTRVTNARAYSMSICQEYHTLQYNPILLVMCPAQRYFKAIPKKKVITKIFLIRQFHSFLFHSIQFIDNPVALFVGEIFHNFGQLLNMINNISETFEGHNQYHEYKISHFYCISGFGTTSIYCFLLRNPNHIGLATNFT